MNRNGKHYGQYIYTAIAKAPIDITKMYTFLQNPSHGALSAFVGRVRNINLNKKVIGISYDVFEPLAVRTFAELCRNALQQWGKISEFILNILKGGLILEASV